MELARIAFGSSFLDDNCVILGNVNVNSPLVWDGAMTGAIRAYAAANQAPVVVPFILGGAMGPVTLAGEIAQAHAETMVGVALGQLTRPGSPVIYGNFLSSMALRSGSPTFGTPEPAIGSLVVGQMARRVGLPLRCSGAFTSAKVVDGQAMLESAVSMQAAILCGANFILHSAGWLEGGLVMGYEKFVVDADFCGALHRYLAGIDLSDEQFALDGFREVGPGKHFFGAEHTLRHYETAFWGQLGVRQLQLRAVARRRPVAGRGACCRQGHRAARQVETAADEGRPQPSTKPSATATDRPRPPRSPPRRLLHLPPQVRDARHVGTEDRFSKHFGCHG